MTDHSVGYRSWNRIRNNGDSIAPYLIELATSGTGYYASGTEPHLLAAGSILFMANQNSRIWGCGVMSKNFWLPSLDPGQIMALRGQKSVDDLRTRGVDLGDIALGDPGIFASEILERESAMPRTTRFRAAVIPHHTAFQHPFFDSIRNSEEFCLVDICDDSLLPMQQIAESEIVISQSLHGLIFGESLGKPCVWISKNQSEDWEFKFKDWFTTVLNPLRPFNMNGNITNALTQSERQSSLIDKAKLLQAFPADLARPSRFPMVGFRDCREYCPVTLFFSGPKELFGGFENPMQDRLDKILDYLAPITSSMFSRWAERPYCICLDSTSRHVPTPKQSERLVAAMDQRFTIDYAFILSNHDLEKEGLTGRSIGEGVFHFPDLKRSGGTLLLRPWRGSLSTNFTVFAI
jgi:hypothetical protein